MSSGAPTVPNDYKYNGIELVDDLGLNLHLAEYRAYDALIGRWTGVDPVNTVSKSSYIAFGGNPVSRKDPDGDTDYYYAKSDGKMAFLGRDSELNGVIAVVTDQTEIQRFINAGNTFINPNKQSYFELPSYYNRQKIKAEIDAHYDPNKTGAYTNILYEVGGVGLNYKGRILEITAEPGSVRSKGHAQIIPFQAKDQSIFDNLETTDYLQLGTIKLFKVSMLTYSWHTHPITGCDCYYTASDKDMSSGAEVMNIRNNFVMGPTNNVVSLYRRGTPKNCKCGTEIGGASGTIPLDWFFTTPDAKTTFESIQPNKIQQ